MKSFFAAILAAGMITAPANANDDDYFNCGGKYQRPIMVSSSNGHSVPLSVNTRSAWCYRENVGEDLTFVSSSDNNSDGGSTDGAGGNSGSGGGDSGGAK